MFGSGAAAGAASGSAGAAGDPANPAPPSSSSGRRHGGPLRMPPSPSLATARNNSQAAKRLHQAKSTPSPSSNPSSTSSSSRKRRSGGAKRRGDLVVGREQVSGLTPMTLSLNPQWFANPRDNNLSFFNANILGQPGLAIHFPTACATTALAKARRKSTTRGSSQSSRPRPPCPPSFSSPASAASTGVSPSPRSASVFSSPPRSAGAAATAVGASSSSSSGGGSRVMNEEARRMTWEVSLLLRLNHSNIVPLIGVTPGDPSGALMLLSSCEEVTLFSYLHDVGHALSPPRALSVAAQIAAAVAYMHQHNVAHTAIHSGNVMLRPHTGTAKLTGLRAACACLPGSGTFLNPGLRANVWASPEMLHRRRDRHVTTAVDVFSLGVLLWEVVRGAIPWHWLADTPQDCVKLLTLTCHHHTSPGSHLLPPSSPLDDQRPMDGDVCGLYRSCCSWDPSDRSSARDVHAILSAMVEDYGMMQQHSHHQHQHSMSMMQQQHRHQQQLQKEKSMKRKEAATKLTREQQQQHQRQLDLKKKKVRAQHQHQHQHQHKHKHQHQPHSMSMMQQQHQQQSQKEESMKRKEAATKLTREQQQQHQRQLDLKKKKVRAQHQHQQQSQKEEARPSATQGQSKRHHHQRCGGSGCIPQREEAQQQSKRARRLNRPMARQNQRGKGEGEKDAAVVEMIGEGEQRHQTPSDNPSGPASASASIPLEESGASPRHPSDVDGLCWVLPHELRRQLEWQQLQDDGDDDTFFALLEGDHEVILQQLLSDAGPGALSNTSPSRVKVAAVLHSRDAAKAFQHCVRMYSKRSRQPEKRATQSPKASATVHGPWLKRVLDTVSLHSNEHPKRYGVLDEALLSKHSIRVQRVFHGVPHPKAAESILQGGFQVMPPKNGRAYGCGIYFTPDLSLAARYAKRTRSRARGEPVPDFLQRMGVATHSGVKVVLIADVVYWNPMPVYKHGNDPVADGHDANVALMNAAGHTEYGVIVLRSEHACILRGILVLE